MSDAPSRIAEIAPADLSPAQAAVLDAVQRGRGFLPMPYRVWLHSAPLADRMERLGTWLNKSSSMSGREFEIAIVVVAHRLASPYVLHAHLSALTRTGHPQDVVDAMRDGRVPTFATDRERAIYEIAVSSTDAEPTPDALFERAVAALGRDGLAELIALLGYYTAVAIAMKMHRVPVSAG